MLRFKHRTEVQVLEVAEGKIGLESKVVRKRLDTKRLHDAKRKLSNKEEEKAKKIRKVQQEEELIAAEGVT